MRPVWVVLLAMLTAAAPAGAATIEVVGVYDAEVIYMAAPGEFNSPTIVANTRSVTVEDNVLTPLTAGPGCLLESPSRAICRAPEGGWLDAARALLGDGDDQAVVAAGGTAEPIFAFVDGADGTDGLRIDRTAGLAYLRGGAGDDSLTGSNAFETFDGGPGRDFMHSSAVLDGTEGARDAVDYRTRTEDLTITFDGAANDGAPGEGDSVGDSVRYVYGGAGDDLIVGTDESESFYGYAGADRLVGGGGADGLVGGEGNDVLDGGAGTDILDDGSGSDRLLGGNGDDALHSHEGADFLSGGTGDDGLHFMSQPLGVRVDFTGADDGAPGEGDDVRADVEIVHGTRGDDTLIGDDRSNYFQGFGGTDTIRGGAGADIINDQIGSGASRIDGGAHPDVLIVYNEDAKVTCGNGADVLGFGGAAPPDCEVVEPTGTVTSLATTFCGGTLPCSPILTALLRPSS